MQEIQGKQQNGFVLMCSENHEGFKLQELAEKLQEEMIWKVSKISHSSDPDAIIVYQNNMKIIEHLGAIQALQLSSERLLDAKKGPNQGPAGQPRI